MAVKAKTVTSANQQVDVVTWAALTQTGPDSGDPVNVDGARALTAYLLSGTLGVAGAVIWEGSHDGVTFFPMNTEIGAPAAVSMVALLAANMLKERPRFIRPRCTLGDGTTSLVPVLIVTR